MGNLGVRFRNATNRAGRSRTGRAFASQDHLEESIRDLVAHI